MVIRTMLGREPTTGTEPVRRCRKIHTAMLTTTAANTRRRFTPVLSPSSVSCLLSPVSAWNDAEAIKRRRRQARVVVTGQGQADVDTRPHGNAVAAHQRPG